MFCTFLLNRYQCRIRILDSADFGDPQSRKRVVIIVSKKPNALPELPKPTHGNGLKPIVTARDALYDLEQIDPREGPGIVALPNGTMVDHHVKSGQTAYVEGETLKADAPAHTVLCGHAVGHYAKNRACTNWECARIQNFPDYWSFCGGHKSVQKQIGMNAVPIALATSITKTIREGVYDIVGGVWDDGFTSPVMNPNPRRVTL